MGFVWLMIPLAWGYKWVQLRTR